MNIGIATGGKAFGVSVFALCVAAALYTAAVVEVTKQANSPRW